MSAGPWTAGGCVSATPRDRSPGRRGQSDGRPRRLLEAEGGERPSRISLGVSGTAPGLYAPVRRGRRGRVPVFWASAAPGGSYGLPGAAAYHHPMNPTAGTAAQIHHATGVSVSAIGAYASQGRITRVGWELSGTRLAPTYDARAVLAVAAERAQVRYDAPRRLRCAAP